MGCVSLLWYWFKETLGCVVLFILAALVVVALLVVACVLWPGLRDIVSGLAALGLLIWVCSFVKGPKGRR